MFIIIALTNVHVFFFNFIELRKLGPVSPLRSVYFDPKRGDSFGGVTLGSFNVWNHSNVLIVYDLKSLSSKSPLSEEPLIEKDNRNKEEMKISDVSSHMAKRWSLKQ